MATLNIRQKLLQIQSRLKAPKNQRNSFGNYNYRSCEDIMEGLKPLLVELAATLTITDSIEHIGERYYIKATARLADVSGEDFIEVSAYAREEENRKGMDSSQVTGSTSSYARKYALNGMFCIDDTKDADATNEHGKGQQQPPAAPPKLAPAPPKQTTPAPPPTTKPVNLEPQRRKLFAMVSQLGWNTDAGKAFIQQETGKGSAKELTQPDFTKLFALLDEQLEAQNAAINAEMEGVI